MEGDKTCNPAIRQKNGKPGRALRGCVIALSGDFGSDRSKTKIRQQIKAAGGKVGASVHSKVTHLVCSRDDYQHKVPAGTVHLLPSIVLTLLTCYCAVKTAQQIGSIDIVIFDWLEDSLLARSVKDANEYLLCEEMKQRQKQKAMRKLKRISLLKKQGNFRPSAFLIFTNKFLVTYLESCCQEFLEVMGHGRYIHPEVACQLSYLIGGYEIYRDLNGLAYDVTLARIDLTLNENERFHLKVRHHLITMYKYKSPRRTRVPLDRPPAQRLQLFQTHSAPKYFACYTTYKSREGLASHQMLAPSGSSFEVAMGQFEQFFKLKTRLLWSDRDSKRVVDDDDECKFNWLTSPFFKGEVGDDPFKGGYRRRVYDPTQPDKEWQEDDEPNW